MFEQWCPARTAREFVPLPVRREEFQPHIQIARWAERAIERGQRLVDTRRRGFRQRLAKRAQPRAQPADGDADVVQRLAAHATRRPIHVHGDTLELWWN